MITGSGMLSTSSTKETLLKQFFFFWPLTADRGRGPPWIPHPAGLAEVPRHIPNAVPFHPSNTAHTPRPRPSSAPSPHTPHPPHCSPSPSPAKRHVMGEVLVGYSGPASPTLPPPVLQPPPRPARPPMTDKRALRRHLQATVLAREPHSSFHSPMHHTFMPHQTSSRPTQPLAPLIPTPQILIHSPLVPHKPLLPIFPHVPMPQLSFIHIQMIHSLFHQFLPSSPVAP